MTYSDKLKDPRWQKIRLEILARDEWKCASCEDSENTLHVHHIVYKKGNNPWDCDDIDLITLCKYCHEVWHHIYDDSKYDSSLFLLVTKLADRLESTRIDYYCKKIFHPKPND